MAADYELIYTDDKGLPITDSRGRSPFATFLALTCTRAVNEIGDFKLRVPASFDKKMIRPDRMLQVWRRPLGGKLALWRVFFTRYWEFATQGSDKIVTIAGPDTNELLRRRHVIAFAGSTQASKTDFADDMMKEIVTESLADGVAPVPAAGSRVWSDLSVAADLSLGPTITKSFPYDKLLTSSGQGVLPTLAKIARENGTEVFFDIVPNVVTGSSINFQFRTYTGQPGADKTDEVTFDETEGNMIGARYSEDYREEENYIYAAGQNEGVLRNIQQVYSAARYGVSQWNRCEGVADARQDDSDNGVIAAGNDKLNDGRPKVRFSAIPLDTRSTRFGVDWDFGDKVTTRYDDLEFESIVRAVAISVNDNGEEDIRARLDYENVI